ncbi:MAG: NAD-dependent deacylase [Candidatus Eremiobacteraeota bacterium]|nr:NAD-dependent deacylase [Candidatus Eremiobacteraeota bacterium]
MNKDTRIIALTGAGVSAESGIPTFRGKEGLWNRYRVQDLATPEAFTRAPDTVWEWYRYRQELIGKAKPNPAHLALAKMEEIFPEFYLITQNIDGLHQKAGNKRVVELHGNIWEARCIAEGKIIECPPRTGNDPVPYCTCGSMLRPNVVWFGEALPVEALERAYQLVQDCEICFVIGTSSLVYPAAGLPMVAFEAGADIIEVNPAPSPALGISIHIREKAGIAMPVILDEISRTKPV